MPIILPAMDSELIFSSEIELILCLGVSSLNTSDWLQIFELLNIENIIISPGFLSYSININTFLFSQCNAFQLWFYIFI